jgi:hypothetical protein
VAQWYSTYLACEALGSIPAPQKKKVENPVNADGHLFPLKEKPQRLVGLGREGFWFFSELV